MKIKSKFQIITVLSIAIALMIAFTLFDNIQDMRVAIKEADKADQLTRGVFELNLLTNDYLSNRTERTRMQWQLRYDSLTELIQNMQFRIKEEQLLQKEILHKHDYLKVLFSRIIANYASRKNSSEMPAELSELEERLVGKLLTNSQIMVSSTKQLIEINHRRLVSAQRKSSLVVILLVILITAIIAANSFVTQKSIIVPISKLQKGTQIIGEGNLNFKIASVAKDEIGDLSRAFDHMTKNLKTVTVSHDKLEDEINERKQAEESMRKSQQKYRDLVESTADWVWTCDPEGRQTFANEAVIEILGYEVHEVIGASAGCLMHPEDAKRMQKWFNKSVEEKKGWQNAVMRWKHKDGTIRFLESSAWPLLDSEGALVGFAGIDRDVTERLRLEQQLLQTQKMEAIGTLAGGVAHDFNNLLSVILGNTDLMLMEIRKDHPFYKGLKEIRKAGTGAASLTRQLLAFSRKQVIQPEIMNLNDVLNTTTKMLERLIGENIDFETFPDPALEPVEADSGQMEQVIINLAVNARDAMPSGGKLTVETKNLFLNEAFFKSQGVEGKAGLYVMLRVSDTGSGMDQEILFHIFDPFFTTKGIDRGTGLGLSTVYGIVKQNNGYIFVDSKPGKGSAFEIYLPAVKKEKKSVAAPTVTADSLTGPETILLVEDDMQLQQLTSRILKRYGYRVLQASNGDEALKVSQKYDGPIDLIITDVIMPGMNVREMTEKIRSRRKETKTLYMSGHIDDTIAHYGILDPGINFLQKPYIPEGLVHKVREVLDQRIDD